MPEISVIVPVFNTAKYLRDCLESIAKQSFTDFEAILIDDGSSDNSADILKEFVQKDFRFCLIQQENAGPSQARNAGIQKAQGNWITFVDSDDKLDPQFLETLYNLSKKQKASIAACDKKTFEDNCHFKRCFDSTSRMISSEEALVRAFYQDQVPDMSIWNKLYHKSLLAGKSFPKGLYFEDIAVIPEILWSAKEIAICDAPLYFYRKHPGSILSSAYDLKKAELLSICEKNLEKFKAISPRVQKAAESLLFSASFSILMRTPKTSEFEGVRSRAWNWIKKIRIQALTDRNSRLRNKIAALLSFLPQKMFLQFLARGHR